MNRYVGAIDQGTTSTRFIVFGRDGEVIGSAQREHGRSFPSRAGSNMTLSEILRNTQSVIESGLRDGRVSAGDLDAVGITNQRETTVLWDRRSGMPLHHAVVWQDTRTEELVREFAREGGPDRFRKKTGLPLASYFSASKLSWLLQEVANARALAESGDALFGTIDSWLVWNLTGGPNGGVHITDVTNASRTQLMNLSTLSWDTGLLAAFEIPAPCLPKIVSSSEPYSEIREGPLKGVQIAGILGDQQAALVGQACFEAGEAKNTYGTGCFLLMNTGTQPVDSKAGLVTTLAYQFGREAPRYALEGSIAVAGALVQWLRDNLQ